MALTTALGLLAALAIFIYTLKSYIRAQKHPFPPGPPTLPFIGNLHQVPSNRPYLAFREWAAKYATTSDGIVGFAMGPWKRGIIISKRRHISDPQVQKRARAEVDALYSSDTTMPQAEAVDKLPYIKACLLEILRWRPIIPLNHRANLQDDVFAGYFIPKGTTVLINYWALGRDPEEFDRPDEFLPERYLDEANRPLVFEFGHGVRSCPGRRMAENSLTLAMAKILWAFEIEPASDARGEEIWTAINAEMPAETPLRFRLRSEAKGRTIEKAWRVADEWLSRFE